MKLKAHVVVTLAALAALFVFARTAHAQSGIGAPGERTSPPAPLTQSYTVDLPLVGSPPVTSFDVPRFDPRLGALQSASIVVEATHVQDYFVMQTGLGRALFWWGDGPLVTWDAPCFSYLQIDAPSGQQACSDLNVWPLVEMKLSNFGAGKSATLVAMHAFNRVDLNTSGLVGTGSATFAVTRAGNVWHSGTTANCVGMYQRRIGAKVTVTYTYR